jgi:glycosyltransferase involved in cell wall biosynthesis
MNNTPSISVVIPAFNAETTIAESLECVARQRFRAAEVIVVDDGSTDTTREVVARFDPDVLVCALPNGGPSAARNHGLQLATGEIVAFLDADDLWPDHTLEVLRTGMEDGAVAQGRIQDMWPEVEESGYRLDQPRRSFNIGSAAFRRTTLEEVGGFDESLRTGEDIDLWVRLKERGVERRLLDDVTLYYRRKLQSQIEDKRNYHANLVRTLKRSLKRTGQE